MVVARKKSRSPPPIKFIDPGKFNIIPSDKLLNVIKELGYPGPVRNVEHPDHEKQLAGFLLRVKEAEVDKWVSLPNYSGTLPFMMDDTKKTKAFQLLSCLAIASQVVESPSPGSWIEILGKAGGKEGKPTLINKLVFVLDQNLIFRLVSNARSFHGL